MNLFTVPANLERLASFAFAFIFFLAALFFSSRLWFPVVIDTNLKNLSPALSDDPQLSQAINWLSSAVEQRFLLLIESQDEDKLFDIADEISHELSQLEYIKPASEAGFSSLLPTLAEYPFNFLTEEDRHSLASSAPKALLKQQLSQLYSTPVSSRIFPLNQDPFNLLGNYVYDLGEKTSGGKFNEEGIIIVPSKAGKRYYQPLAFTLPQGGLSMDIQEQLLVKLNSLQQKIIDPDPQIHLHRSGIIFYAAEAARQSKRDISTISIGSSIGVTLLLIIAFPSATALLIPIFSIAFGIAFAFAATHYIFSSVHILTIVFGASLIGIVIDYAIHYFFHWPAAQNIEKRRALYRALALSLLTSTIGYGALGISDLLSLKQIAVFSCFGLVAAWLSIVALSPKLLSANFTPKTGFFLQAIESLRPVVATLNRVPLIIIFPCLVVVFVLILSRGLNTSDSPRSLFTPSKALLQQDKKISAVINNYEPGKYVVLRAENEAALFDQLTLLAQRSAEFQLMSLLNWLPSVQTQQANHSLQKVLYKPKGVIEDFYGQLGVTTDNLQKIQAAYEQQAAKTLSIETFFAEAKDVVPPLWVKLNKQHYAFALIPKGSDLGKLQQSLANLDDIYYVDTLANATQALKQQRLGASQMLAIAFLLIACVLLIRYRTLSSLLLLCVPLCSSLIVIVGLHSFGIGITLFHTVALFLVLGLGMDYVIFSEESHSSDPNTMIAIFVSTLTSLLSFGLLATSSLPIVNAIGSTVLIGNLCNFCAVLGAFFKNNSKN